MSKDDTMPKLHKIPPIGTNFMHHLFLNTLVLKTAATKREKSRDIFLKKKWKFLAHVKCRLSFDEIRRK